MTVHCKKCGGRAFKDISSLRKHQWADHRESFKNLIVAAHKVDRKAVYRQHKPLVKLEPVAPNGKRPLLASELLAQLQSQQRFIGDVVSLISGLISQHEENK